MLTLDLAPFTSWLAGLLNPRAYNYKSPLHYVGLGTGHYKDSFHQFLLTEESVLQVLR